MPKQEKPQTKNAPIPGPPQAPTPEQIALLRKSSVWLSIVAQLFTNRMNVLLAPHDMTLTQFSILNHIANREIGTGTTISQIASAVEAQQPAVTKVVTKFEKLNLIKRQDVSNDKRTKQVCISQHGAQQLMQIQKAIGQDLRGVFSVFDEDEMVAFSNSLEKLGKHLDLKKL
ncbi:MAG: MarR family winged helix-turn-helix transcriptional regulator [Nitratireductor sp.]